MISNKNDKIGILHLITGLGIGGAENVVYDLAIHTDSKKFDIYVKSMSKSRIELLDKFKKSKIDTEVLKITKNPIKFISTIQKLNSFITEYKIKIIHVHMFHALVLTFFLKIINPKIKIVFTYHVSGAKKHIREFILFLLLPVRDIDIIFSEKSKEYFCKDKYKVIPNGIDIQKYKISKSKFDKFTFITVGRLENSKNHKALIDICKKLEEEYEFQVLIVGTGYLEEELKQLVIINQLEQKIKFLGIRHDIPELLAKSHVFILPSIREGLPIVLLEAGASAMPVISTDVGSIPLLLDKKNSFICNIKEFPKQMIKVIKNYNFALEKGKLLKEKVYSTFSIDQISYEHEIIYLELCNALKK